METINAPEGGWLTQAADIDPSSRIMAKEVSGFAVAAAYRPATEEEYALWLQAQQREDEQQNNIAK